jgi:hypothetical protein
MRPNARQLETLYDRFSRTMLIDRPLSRGPIMKTHGLQVAAVIIVSGNGSGCAMNSPRLPSQGCSLRFHGTGNH